MRERSEGTQGVVVASLGGVGEAGGGRDSVGARHAPVCPPGRGGRRRCCPFGLGCYGAGPGGLQVSLGELLSLSLFYLCFSISVICFDLI